jgi:hypothetical protein
MLEFKEMVTGLTKLNMSKGVDLSKNEGMEGDNFREIAESNAGNDFTINWAEVFP